MNYFFGDRLKYTHRFSFISVNSWCDSFSHQWDIEQIVVDSEFPNIIMQIIHNLIQIQ